MDNRSAILARSCFGLVALTWGLMVFGASVRVHGAGLACPDWPLCFGEVIPTIDFGVFFEFGHRVVAGLVSLIYAAIGAAVFWTGRSRRVRALWAIGFVVLAIQVVLGGLTVLELLAEWTVTSHLLAGNTFCLTVLLLGLANQHDAQPTAFAPVTWTQRAAGLGVAALLAGQLALGGLVSSSHAGLVCPSWPSCAGDAWFPSFAGLLGLQVTHRLMAYALGAGVLGLLAVSASNATLRRPAALATVLVLLQIALGVANVLWRLPVEITLAHTGIAAFLVLTTTWFSWRAFMAPVAASAPNARMVEAR
jgi:cytochrome c oxidase assembly protein subunit 15